MSKLYVLLAETEDSYYGEVIVKNVLFTEDDVNRINADYLKWYDNAEKEGIIDKGGIETEEGWWGEIETEEGWWVDPFMYYLEKYEEIFTNYIGWICVYFKEITMYKGKEK